MKKNILLILIFIFKLSFAQVSAFFNAQKVGNGFFIGTEIIDQKTNLVLNPNDFVFQWNFPIFTSDIKKSLSNILYLIPTNQNIDNLSVINLTINKFINQKSYQLTGKAEIFLPTVKIVKKTNGLILPLGSSINKNDVLTVIVKNFSSTNFRYLWTFNNIFVSNQKEISAQNLLEKNGLIKIKITTSAGEIAVDSSYLEIK